MKIHFKKIVIVFAFLFFLSSCTLLQINKRDYHIAILLPNAKVLDSANFKQVRMSSYQLQFFLNEIKEINAEVLPLESILKKEISLNKYDTIISMIHIPLEAKQWEKLDKYLKKGGSIIWNGAVTNKTKLEDLDKEYLQKLAGIYYKGVIKNSDLKRKLYSFAWISPTDSSLKLVNNNKPYPWFATKIIDTMPLSAQVIATWESNPIKSKSKLNAILLNKPYKKATTVFFTGDYLFSFRHPTLQSTQYIKELIYKLLFSINNIPKDKTSLNLRSAPNKYLGNDTSNDYTPKVKLPSENIFLIKQTYQIINKEKQKELLNYCISSKILKLLLPLANKKLLDSPKIADILENFIKNAHEKNIKVYALDTHKTETLKSNTNLLNRIIKFNKERKFKFDGLYTLDLGSNLHFVTF